MSTGQEAHSPVDLDDGVSGAIGIVKLDRVCLGLESIGQVL